MYKPDIFYIHNHYYQFYPQEFKVYSALVQFVKDKNKWTSLFKGKLTLKSFKTKIDRYVQNIYKAFKERLIEDQMIQENVTITHFTEYEMGWYDPMKRVPKRDMETQYNQFIETLYDKLYLVHKKKLTIPIVNAYFTEQFAGKLDVFSAGVIMLNNLNRANNTKFLNSELRQNYLGIIRDAINFNPYERETIQNIVKQFKKGVLPYQPKMTTETPKTSLKTPAKTPAKTPKTPKSKTSDKDQFIARCKANHTKEQIKAFMKKNGIKSEKTDMDALCTDLMPYVSWYE